MRRSEWLLACNPGFEVSADGIARCRVRFAVAA